MRRNFLFAAMVAGTALSGGLAGTAQSQELSNGRPDFSGVYFPVGRTVRTPNPLPFTDEAQALADEFNAAFEDRDDAGKFCIWPGMPRVIWGAPFAIEIIHRPQDVTLYWEGYGMYRKIYMEDAPHPDAILPTAMGHSLGHWEGDTLVVETTDLREYPIMNEFPTTEEVRVTERYRRAEREINGEMRKLLVADVVVEDPAMYSEPVTIHGEIALEPDMHILEYNCSTTLWEEYLLERNLTLPDLGRLTDE